MTSLQTSWMSSKETWLQDCPSVLKRALKQRSIYEEIRWKIISRVFEQWKFFHRIKNEKKNSQKLCKIPIFYVQTRESYSLLLTKLVIFRLVFLFFSLCCRTTENSLTKTLFLHYTKSCLLVFFFTKEFYFTIQFFQEKFYMGLSFIY